MLVYHVKEKALKLIKLPTKEQSQPWVREHLSGSEGGLHCFLYSKDRFRIWRYVGGNLEDEIGYKEDDEITPDEKWHLKYTVEIDPLMTQHPDIFGTIYEKFIQRGHILFHPFDFDEDLQILQLHVPGMIVSYSFHTQRLTKLWSYKLPDSIFSCINTYFRVLFSLNKCFPIAFAGMNMPTRDESQMLQL